MSIVGVLFFFFSHQIAGFFTADAAVQLAAGQNLKIMAISQPFITAMILTSIFLVANGQTIYLVPALSILTGLLCLAFVNLFHMKELLVAGDWMLVTGLLSLFFAQFLHPLLALILTFGLGFCTVLPANWYLGRHK